LKQFLAKGFAVMIMAYFVAGFYSCKEDTILGSNVIPVDDTANTIAVPDTLTILTKTILSGRYKTSTSISGIPIYHALGTVGMDPHGGKTTAGFYLQVVPPSLGYAFPKTPDSAVLILPYAGFTWGDTTSGNLDQQIKVYEIANTDSIVLDSSYYSNSITAYVAQAIDDPASPAFIGYNATGSHPSIKDSVTVLGQKRFPHVRVRLSQQFLSKIVNEAAKTSGSALGAYADFLHFLRGLYVTTADTNNGNALYYFMLNGSGDFSRANIQFYYTDQKTGGGDTVKYVSFYFDQTRNAHYNSITRNPFASPSLAALLNSTNASDSVVVLQNEPGAALDIKIPHIKNLPRQPIIKAELVITQFKETGDESDKYFPPSRLFPVRVQGDSTVSIQDRYPLTSSEPLVFMDGLRHDYTLNGTTYSQYVLNIPREIQRAIIEQRDTLHLRINGAATFPGAYRLRVAGRSLTNNDLRIKLRIFYAKI